MVDGELTRKVDISKSIQTQLYGNSGSLKGELGTKIDLEYGANVQSIECGDDNQSMVILNSSNGNYPTPSVGVIAYRLNTK